MINFIYSACKKSWEKGENVACSFVNIKFSLRENIKNMDILFMLTFSINLVTWM